MIMLDLSVITSSLERDSLCWIPVKFLYSACHQPVIHCHGLNMQPVMNDPNGSPGDQIPEPDCSVLAAGYSYRLLQMNLCHLMLVVSDNVDVDE